MRDLRLLALSLLAAACADFRSPSVPLRTIRLTPSTPGHCLAVLLPGRRSFPEEFETSGHFGDAVTERGLPIDIIAVDAHLGYFRNRSVVDRLRADVIEPAKASGYDSIWLVGTSLGGLGSLLYLREHPEDISGVAVFAAYLGEEDVVDEIEKSGGPARWMPPTTIAQNDVGRTIWSWLAPGGATAAGVPVYVGWGTNDRFRRSNALLAALLPKDHQLTVEGGHNYETWGTLWRQFLDRVQPCR